MNIHRKKNLTYNEIPAGNYLNFIIDNEKVTS
jgi:hypothetical protein